MAVLFANNATGRLASSVSLAQTTISLQGGQGARFPSPSGGDWFPVTAIKPNGDLEIMRCTARTGDVLTVQRGQEQTSPMEFLPGERVELRMTRQAIIEITSGVELRVTDLEGRTLTAGNGLTGGGNLTANRTFTLGTPGSLNGSTSNAVTAGSHTHAISLTAADVGAPPTSRSISTGSGLTGGGNLTADRTLSVDSTVVRTSLTLTAGNGLSGGGTLAGDRTFALGTPGTLTGSTTNSVTASSHTHAINLSASDVGAPPTSRSITAGNGLSGGGDLSANRTITLGTPGAITATSTNSVSATSHTHAITEGTIRTLIAAGTAGALGTYAMLRYAGSNATGSLPPGTTQSGSNLRFSAASGSTSGGAPSGTWMAMGQFSTYNPASPNAGHATVFMRIS